MLARTLLARNDETCRDYSVRMGRLRKDVVELVKSYMFYMLSAINSECNKPTDGFLNFLMTKRPDNEIYNIANFAFVNATVFESQLVRIVDMPSARVTTQLHGATREPVDIAVQFGISAQAIMYSFVGRLPTAGSPLHAVASLCFDIVLLL